MLDLANPQARFPICVMLVSILLCLLLTGCSAGPARTDSDNDVAASADDILVTLGPQAFLNFMAAAMVEADPALAIVDGASFRASAFPTGDATLAALMAPATRDRIQRELGVDHVVLFGPMTFPADGPPVPIDLGSAGQLPFGVGRLENSPVVSGVVIDLVHNSLVSEVDVTAAGSSSFAAWVFMAGSFSDREKNALRALARTLATQLHGHEEEQPNRVALLAAESARLWRPAGSGSWTRVEGAGSEANPVFEVSGVCGLQGVQASLQQAFDRAMGLYHAKAWDAAYVCFRFVREAGGDGSRLPQEASRHMRAMEERGVVASPPPND